MCHGVRFAHLIQKQFKMLDLAKLCLKGEQGLVHLIMKADLFYLS